MSYKINKLDHEFRKYNLNLKTTEKNIETSHDGDIEGIMHYVKNFFDGILRISGAQVKENFGILENEEKEEIIKKSYKDSKKMKSITRVLKNKNNQNIVKGAYAKNTTNFDSHIKTPKQIMKILSSADLENKINNENYNPLRKTRNYTKLKSEKIIANYNYQKQGIKA